MDQIKNGSFGDRFFIGFINKTPDFPAREKFGTGGPAVWESSSQIRKINE